MLDYTKREKKNLPVKLAEDVEVFLRVPTKALYSRLAGVVSALKETTEVESVFEELLTLCADILSNNLQQRAFTAEEVAVTLDIEDMALLIREYAAFTGEAIKNPN